MQKRTTIITLLSISLCNLCFADSSIWDSAYLQYQNNNLTSLSVMATTNPNDDLINYLYADAALNKSSPDNALRFIANHKNNYFSLTLAHKLLTYYFNHQNWQQYLNTYNQMSATQVSTNETCGYDLATYALNTQGKLKSNLNEIIRNKMPIWCTSLIATRLANDENKNLKSPFLFFIRIKPIDEKG